jgi:hypothetical protein
MGQGLSYRRKGTVLMENILKQLHLNMEKTYVSPNFSFAFEIGVPKALFFFSNITSKACVNKKEFHKGL